MKRLSIALLSLVIITAGCKTTAQSKTGFVKIFDGKTLKGWEGDTAYWRVENGNIIGEITPTKLLKTNSFLIYRGATPDDFELTLEFRITAAGNSGINYRSTQLTDVPFALRGYQADIDGATRYTGQNYEERARTTLAYRGERVFIATSTGDFKSHLKNNAWTERKITGSLGSSDSLKTFIKSEDWNTCRLVVKGNKLQHYINGVLMSEVVDDDTENRKMSGLLGVQVHVGPPMKVEYKDIMLRKFE